MTPEVVDPWTTVGITERKVHDPRGRGPLVGINISVSCFRSAAPRPLDRGRDHLVGIRISASEDKHDHNAVDRYRKSQ